MATRFWTFVEITTLLVMAYVVAKGSAQDTKCLNDLAPCLNYLNGAKDVPDSCCDPLKTVINSDMKCLCDLVSTEGANQAQHSGINITAAQELPAKCGQHINLVSCLKGGSSPGSTNSPTESSTSASVLLFPSLSMAAAVVLFMAVHVLM